MSKPISDKKSVKLLLDVCQQQGLKHVVISPGSRNAPLIISFASSGLFRCYPIVDERSAAYFALGMAQQFQEPVALVCTSGTAVLNYAPAIAEAYYQHIPLVVITADRPKEWVGQADGQTIDQSRIFQNYINYQCDLPVDVSTEDDEWYVARLVSEAFMAANGALAGPVHINIPLREPLYGRTVHPPKMAGTFRHIGGRSWLDEEQLTRLAQSWHSMERVMVLVGMMPPNAALAEVLNRLSVHENVVVLTESLSNCYGKHFVRCVDRVVASIRDEEKPLFRPDLLITLDGPVLSKMVKTLIRQYPPKEHWHFSQTGQVVDTYRHLSVVVDGDSAAILAQLEGIINDKKSRYRETWLKRVEVTEPLHAQYINTLPWCDMKVYDCVLNAMPKDMPLQLGNSTPVRYAQFFDVFEGVQCCANRGTSGIDGCVSTALGAAFAMQQNTLLLVGDMSFFYDSNALWNRFSGQYLKIIVVNNSGGGIFRFLPGSSDSEELEEFFAVGHQMNAAWVAQRFGVAYRHVASENELAEALPAFFASTQTEVLEVETPLKDNAKMLKNYFSMLKR
jgi:2-succinyl-5-enolpyruvyl-6-hydroxy-3-cyclohexene-1-carboxylate synthase